MKYFLIPLLIIVLATIPIYFGVFDRPVIKTEEDLWISAIVVIIYCAVIEQLGKALLFLLRRAFPKKQ